jgi:uncharacterized protein (TIGR03086 family)
MKERFVEEAQMTEISERYARLSGAFADTVAGVPDDRWSSPSPCPEWTARDIVGHVVETQGMFLGFVGRETGDIPPVDQDPLGAWTAASAVVLKDLEDPGRASAEFEGFFGKSTFEAAVDRFLNMDLVVHRWDLARATGQDEHIDPEDVARVRRRAEEFGDAMRAPKAFGPTVDPPPGADEQAKLLAFLGRRV